MLARVDYQGTWPPPRNFDLDLVLIDVDPRIRPGMTAVARIAIERIPNVVLIPSEAIFQHDGATVVYELKALNSTSGESRSGNEARNRRS